VSGLLGRVLDDGWTPVPVPEVVVDIFLADRPARPAHRCEACGVPLPRQRTGIWREASTEPGKWDTFWSGPLHYFEVCPVCGGCIIQWDGDPPATWGGPGLPAAPGGKWTFTASPYNSEW
jgi:hypothetical protein